MQRVAKIHGHTIQEVHQKLGTPLALLVLLVLRMCAYVSYAFPSCLLKLKTTCSLFIKL